jgi:heavy metal translocating P-type ATPase
MKQKFDITGMSCSACSAHVEKSVCQLQGIKQVSVNLLQNSMLAEYDETVLSPQEIIQAVEDGGYGASLHNDKAAATPSAPAQTSQTDEIKHMKFRLIFSILVLIPLMYISMGHMMGLPVPGFLHGDENALAFAFTQFLLTLPVMYVNRKFYIVGFRSLFKKAPNMDSLIAIGSSAAVIYGIISIYTIGWGLGHGDMALVHAHSMDLYFESAAMILTLITLGKFFEARSKGKTSEAINKLMDLAPKTATVVRNGQEQQIPVEDLLVGDTVIVKAGQSIPADGVILEGRATVDESALTGESLPVEKAPGDHVTGASIAKSGYFTFRAQKVGADTVLSQIIQLVEDANATKAPIAKLADKVSGVFVPTVILIALAATIIWLLVGQSVGFAISIGISVLVVSCPCALGLATPTAIMVGTGKGAEHGILYKTAESLETTHQVDTVVLDKTGTITQGQPTVTDCLPAGTLTQEELLTIAASIETLSDHPLAHAITNHAKEQNLTLTPAQDFRLVDGRGVICTMAGKEFLGGNRAMMEEHGIALQDMEERCDQLAQQGKTPLYFAGDGKLLGVIAVADVIKKTSPAAIRALKQMGIHVVMLTGDNRRTAEAIRSQLEIDQAIAEVLPQDKERHVRQLQEEGHKVAMVGDGINDAPALTRADVGMAIGAGTDIAMESADVVLMKSDLMDAVTAIQLSHAVIRNIKQNLFWAFFYNALGIPLAAGVFYTAFGLKLSPMFGAAAMSLSSVCVVSNALRLKFFKPKHPSSPEEADIQPETNDRPNQPEEQNKGDDTMKKTMVIEGMMCPHCSGRVEQALNALDGVSAQVDLEKKSAFITLSKEVSDETLTKVVTDAGYQVISVE